jgi:hypothetical protein
MSTFRKKPVEVQAMQLLGSEDGSAGRAVAEWCGGSLVGTFDEPHLDIRTLEGIMCANPGDWIIRGVRGEFYPCKPDIFAETYEAVTE